MITLNSEHGLTKIESWEDILSLPGFTTSLDPREHDLSEIIGRYMLPDSICGLSNCHTRHERGYVVITKSGAKTNIGKDCGAKYFGVHFEELSKVLDRAIDEKELREQLESVVPVHIEDRVEQMLNAPRGASWVHKRIQNLKMRGGDVPEEVISRLAAMVKTGTGRLTSPREASPEEVATLRTSGVKIKLPHYIDEQVGEIEGFQALYPENDLRELLVMQIENQLKEFKKLAIGNLNYEQLKHWVKWVNTLDVTFDTASKSINLGNRLLSPDNLKQFSHVLAKPQVQQFRRFISSCE